MVDPNLKGSLRHSKVRNILKDKQDLVESLQSHSIHTQFLWSSGGPPVCFPLWGAWVQSPGGYLCETGILLLALSCYIGDPDWSLWLGGLPPEPSLGRRADNVIIPLDLTQLFCTGFTSSGPPVCFPSWGTWVQYPGGVPMWNRDSPVSVVSLQTRLWQARKAPPTPSPPVTPEPVYKIICRTRMVGDNPSIHITV